MRKHQSHPHPGRSYTSAHGAFVRVDYVKPCGDVCFVIWPTWWKSKEGGTCMRYTAADFAEMVEAHNLQPVSA